MKRYLRPDQFGMIYSSLLEMPLAEFSPYHYQLKPGYMAALEEDIALYGIQLPVETASGDDFDITSGHHRAAVAYRLRLPISRVSEDDPILQTSEFRQTTMRWHQRWKEASRWLQATT